VRREPLARTVRAWSHMLGSRARVSAVRDEHGASELSADWHLVQLILGGVVGADRASTCEVAARLVGVQLGRPVLVVRVRAAPSSAPLPVSRAVVAALDRCVESQGVRVRAIRGAEPSRDSSWSLSVVDVEVSVAVY